MKKFMKDLLPNEQQWLAKAIVSIVLANGIIEDLDITFMKKKFKFFLEEESLETLTHISTLLKEKKIPDLEKIHIDNLDRLVLILDILTAAVFANGKKLNTEVKQYFEAGKKLGLAVGTLSYRLSLEAEKERIKRKLIVIKDEIVDFLRIV